MQYVFMICSFAAITVLAKFNEPSASFWLQTGLPTFAILLYFGSLKKSILHIKTRNYISQGNLIPTVLIGNAYLLNCGVLALVFAGFQTFLMQLTLKHFAGKYLNAFTVLLLGFVYSSVLTTNRVKKIAFMSIVSVLVQYTLGFAPFHWLQTKNKTEHVQDSLLEYIVEPWYGSGLNVLLIVAVFLIYFKNHALASVSDQISATRSIQYAVPVVIAVVVGTLLFFHHGVPETLGFRIPSLLVLVFIFLGAIYASIEIGLRQLQMLHSLDDENFASYMVFPISYASNCLMMQLASSYVYSIMACTAYFTCAIGLLITFFCVYDSFHKAENTTTWAFRISAYYGHCLSLIFACSLTSVYTVVMIHGCLILTSLFMDDAILPDLKYNLIPDVLGDEHLPNSSSRRIEAVARYVREAIKQKASIGMWDIEHPSRTKFRTMFQRLYYVRRINLLVYMGLLFFEFPLWCTKDNILECFIPGTVLSSNLPVLSVRHACMIELSCLTIFTIELGLKFKYLGMKYFQFNYWYLVQICLVYTAFVSSFDAFYNIRVSLLRIVVRPLFFAATSSRVRTAIEMLIKVIPRFLDGLIILVILTVIYGVFGLVLFDGTTEGTLYFSTFEDAILSLLILLTTANYPDVMMPTYRENRWHSIYFISYLLLGLFFFLNLLFASIYQKYREQVELNAQALAEQRNDAIKQAFNLLDHNSSGTISHSDCGVLLETLKQPLYSFISRKPVVLMVRRSSLLLGQYSKDADSVSYDSFAQLVNTIHVNSNTDVHAKDYLLRRHVESYDSTMLASWQYRIGLFFSSYRYKFLVVLVVVCNFSVIVFEANSQIVYKRPEMLRQWERTMIVFSSVYWIEIVLKIYSTSFKMYFKNWCNVFDCAMTIIVFSCEVAAMVLHSNWSVIQIIVLLRVLRCLRLLVDLQGLNRIFAIFVRLIPAFTTLYGMLGVTMYIYAIIGMSCFGGKIYIGNAMLVNTTFDSNNYYPNNFNDFGSSLVTLFELLVVNNWFITMDGIVAVTSLWSRLYFVSFYIIAVVMILNVIVAFLVDSFFERREAIVQQG